MFTKGSITCATIVFAKGHVQASVVLPGKSHEAVVFAMPHETNVARMVRADLKEAHETWVRDAISDPATYAQRVESDFLLDRNHQGDAFDFHGFRHTCGAWLALSGVNPKTIQAVMRHSTITLTMDTYGHLLPGQKFDAIGQLGRWMQGEPDPTRQTGTYGVIGHQGIEKTQRAARHSLPNGATAGESGGADRVANREPNPLPLAELSGSLLGIASECENRPGLIRTDDQGIMSPVATTGTSAKSIEKNAHCDSVVDGSAAQSAADGIGPRVAELPADLQAVIAAWGDLPEAIRFAIARLASLPS